MFENLKIAIPLGIFLSFTIGPVFFVLLETAATKGIRAALSFDAGVFIADVLFITVAFFSTTQLVKKVKDDPNLLVFGGVLLAAYGIISFVNIIKNFRKIVREHSSVKLKKKYGQLFIKGFLLNFINIGVLAGWIGVLFLANTVSDNQYQAIGFVTVVLISYSLSDVIKMLISKSLKSRLNSRIIIRMKKIISLIILGFGLFLIAEGLFPKVKKHTKEQIEKINPLNRSK